MLLRQAVVALAFVFMPLVASAEPSIPHFKTVAQESSISFEVMWDGEVLSGSFKKFDIDIAFDPARLEQSSADVIIYIDSVSVANSDAQATLPEKDWFHSELFPIAKFHTTNFKLIEEKRYQAHGELTLKGQTVPVTLMFMLEDFSPSKAVITGATVLNRTNFGVGWKNTESVSDKVTVNVSLIATP